MAPLRVLFFEADPLTSEVRVRPLLDVLKASGRIAGYAIANRDLAISGDNFDEFDVAIAHRNPSTRQIAWLRQQRPPLLYDIDDLLLLPKGVAAQKGRTAEQAAISWCLEQAAAISSPSRRLMANLEARLPANLQARTLVLPNCGAETPPAEKGRGRARLIWVSSAAATHRTQFEDIARGVANAAAAINTDIVLVGRFPEWLSHLFPRREQITWLPYTAYLSFLAQGAFIGVAPLSTGLAPDEQAFIDSKSDIKAAEFGSHRIAGAYSPALPYRESELPCTIVTANTAAAWADALLALASDFPERGNRLATHPALGARRPSVIAGGLYDALAAVAAGAKPFAFRAVPTPGLGRQIERGIRRLRRQLFAKS